jgi:IS605 OrfB family transposase
MSKIHRSYEVLIEETVTSENREQRKHGTSKTLNHNAKTADALRLTNEMFQDAVCYYTLMLAGMVKDARWSEETFSYAKWMEDKLKAKGWQARQKQLIGQPINPLWQHITNSVEMRDATANVVKRLAQDYPHAFFHRAKDAEGLVQKSFCYQGADAATSESKRRDQPPSDSAMIRTFVAHLMPQVVEVKNGGDSLQPQKIKSFASGAIADLCNPSSQAKNLVGFYDQLHQKLLALVGKTEAAKKWQQATEKLDEVKQRKVEKAERDSLREAEKAAQLALFEFVAKPGPLHDELVLCVNAIAKKRADESVSLRDHKRADAVSTALKEAAANPKRKPDDTDDAIRNKAEKSTAEDWAKMISATKDTYRDAFLDTKTARHLATDLSKLREQVGAANKDDPRFRRLQELGAQGVKRDDKAISKPLYRLLWIVGSPEHNGELRRKAAADVLEFVVSNKPAEALGDSDRMPHQQFKGEPLFPFFTNSLGLAPDDQCVFKVFDIAAFKRATEDVFKYANRVAERRRKIEGLKTDKGFFDGKGRLAEKQKKDGKPRFAIFGMEGDDERRKRMEEVISELGRDRASGESGYGIRSSTIGGWPYLRPELLKVYDRQKALRDRLEKRGKLNEEKEEKLEEHCETRLLATVDKARSKSGGGFGSADFFYALCREENRILWMDDWEDRKKQEWHAPDFVAHFARYSKKLEDLRDIADETENWKSKSINYSWPGQVHFRKKERSFKPFDFKCDIRTQPSIELFARDGAGQIQRVTTNKATKGKTPDFPLTLSFRRLKRDRITDGAGNSVEAFFAPPKLAARGAPQPPVLAGPRIRPDDFKTKELDAFLEDFSNGRMPGIEKLIQHIADELKRHHLEIQRLTMESQTSKKALKQLPQQKRATLALLCTELNRLISDAAPLYVTEKLSKQAQKRIGENPLGLEHRLQNRLAIQKTFGGFVKAISTFYNEAVSLLAPKQSGGAFHFMFAVELDEADLKDFHVPKIPGEQPFRRTKQGETWVAANLRWPVDLKTESEDRIRKEEKAKKVAEDIHAIADEGDDGKKPSELPKREELWCASTNLENHALFVDLGVRFAGAWSRARIRHAEGTKPDTAHIISPPKGHPDYQSEIWCELYSEGTFRLQGEDAKVWHRPKCGDHAKESSRFSRQEIPKLDENGEPQWPDASKEKDGWRYGRELYGSRGRLASPDEIAKFKELAEKLFPSTNRFQLPAENSDAARFIPAMAEHLVARLDRRLGRINFLFNLRWRLEGTMEQDPTTRQFTRKRDEKVDEPKHRRMVVEALAPAKLRPDTEDAEEIRWNDELRSKLTDDWEDTKGLLRKDKRRKQRQIHDAEWDERIAKISKEKQWKWEQLADAVHTQLSLLLGELGVAGENGLVAEVARFVWPLRDKRWHWRKHTIHANGEVCPSLLNTEPLPKDSEKRKIIGQGGLNMQRVESLQRFRRCCQSLAKHEERLTYGRTPGQKGLEPYIVPRGESVHDPCPDLLEKINEMRDQRVNQTAALILAEALGLELMNPADVPSLEGLSKAKLKSERDVHGRYQRRKLKLDGKETDAPQCSLIVVEDLSRYLTSLDRSRFENRRLMEWSHRQVIKKLKDMAQVFGIEIMAVDARYSSRFCSKTHVPGVRVAEVKHGFEKDHPWRKWHDEKFNGKLTKRADRVREIAKEFEKNPKATLLIEMEGGPLFLGCNGEKPRNADINASKNVGFRGVAHPDLWEFFPVVRAETATDGKLRIINRRGTLAALKPDDAKREFAPTAPKKETKKKENASGATGDDDENETSERPYLFVSGKPKEYVLPLGKDENIFDLSPIHNADEANLYRTARGGLFWKLVGNQCRERIDEINKERLKMLNSP